MQNKYKIGKAFIVRLLKAFMVLWKMAQSQKQEKEIKEKVCEDDIVLWKQGQQLEALLLRKESQCGSSLKPLRCYIIITKASMEADLLSKIN